MAIFGSKLRGTKTSIFGMFLRQRYIGIFWGPADEYKGFQSLLHLVVGIKILYAQVEFVWDIRPTTAAYVTYHWQKFLF